MPKLLDLYCGGGGSALGFMLAGWDVVGVDVERYASYPGEFIQGDALEVGARLLAGGGFDAVNASPPCQEFSVSSAPWKMYAGKRSENMIPETRELLRESGLPYVMENVPTAPLVDPVMLCGTMFPGLRVYRHRNFESNFPIQAPRHRKHTGYIRPVNQNCKPLRDHHFMTVTGHCHIESANECMGIRGMRGEISQAIPPRYTALIGFQLREWLGK